MTRRLVRERNTCALIEEFNGRLTAVEPGADPVILNNLCSKGWLPFLHTALRYISLYPIRTFKRTPVSTQTCPGHAFVHASSEEMLKPSETTTGQATDRKGFETIQGSVILMIQQGAYAGL